MNRIRWVGSIGLLLLTSCAVERAPDQAASGTVSVATSPSLTAPAPQSPSATVAVPRPAQSPIATVAVPPAPPVLAVPDLIPPTSVAARVPQIDAGRSNPYATVTTSPRVTVTPSVRPAATPSVAARPAASPTRSIAPAATRPSEPIAPPVPQTAPVVPSPVAVIAQSIAVSGIVQTSGQTSAIVQIPQEGSRYVSAGDRIAGGRVLVKRIEAESADPVVVFEQDGVEVSRPVGTSGVL